MTMSFMQAIGKQIEAHNQVNKPLVLNEGQMIYGRIRQLYPGQLAEVQIGKQKMIARIEVPLKAGESYYFQVRSINPEVQLKIISGSIDPKGASGREFQNLMQAMQLPKSTEMTNLLSFVIENKIPITRENLLQAVKLLQTTPSSHHYDALVSIQKLVELKLPLTESLFQSILGVKANEGLHTIIDTFREALLKDSSVQAPTRASIIQQLDNLKEPFILAKAHNLLGQSLKTLMDTEQSAELRFSALQLLKESNILPDKTSLPNLQNTLASLIAQRIGIKDASSETSMSTQMNRLDKFVSELPFLSASQKASLSGEVQHIGEQGNRGLQQFASALVQMIVENLITNSPHASAKYRQDMLTLLTGDEQAAYTEKVITFLKNAEQSGNVVIQKMIQLAEINVTNSIDGKMMKETMQLIFRSLGLNYEALLNGKEVQVDRLFDTLKPQLLSIINNPAVTSHVREIAEQVIIRMNGTPLMSVENGTNYQLIMQLPFEFFGKKIDATLQWNGMKDDKKIDANFARILFYLKLHSLKETVVDMQVQSKVVTVTIFNENSTLSTIGYPLQEKLKSGLESAGYKLSGVFFKSFDEGKRKAPSNTENSVNRQGVDLRI